jgi:hypothetical protein
MKNICILITEEFFKNEKSNYKDLCHFLELEPFSPEVLATRKVGHYSKACPIEARLKLQDFYRPFNRKLFKFLKKTISKWG